MEILKLRDSCIGIRLGEAARSEESTLKPCIGKTAYGGVKLALARLARTLSLPCVIGRSVRAESRLYFGWGLVFVWGRAYALAFCRTVSRIGLTTQISLLLPNGLFCLSPNFEWIPE